MTTGIAVPDGRDDEDLGRNFREIAATILDRFIAPHREELARVFDELRRKASAIIARELAEALARPTMQVGTSQSTGSRWLFASGKSGKRSQPSETIAERDLRIASEWLNKAQRTHDRLEAGAFGALHRVATAVIGQHGRLLGDTALLEELAVTLLCNDFGSEAIGEAILPFVQQAVTSEGFRFLPRQDKPVVMNVKGASASGKSSMRPLQKMLAGKLGLPWDEFALISPDIWRKFLLDYTSLGTAYKYAGALTGHEIEIIDKKLDHRMAGRAALGEMPHLLIDRFRFDSFVPNLEEGSSRLLTRFGDLVYMFFMITPPETTVERAWTRGLKVGRYKAVEDLLAHNVEAYAGMPELFFTWALIAGKRVHYEFLDWLGGSFRYGYFDDRDGGRTGVAQRLQSWTFVPVVHLSRLIPNLRTTGATYPRTRLPIDWVDLKVEYRLNHSNRTVFSDAPPGVDILEANKTSHQVQLQVVVNF